MGSKDKASAPSIKLNVFYLDDEPDLCEVFSDEFSSDEIQITTFVDPQKAIEVATKTPPDLMFLDYRLPAITGEDVALKLPVGIRKFLITGDLQLKTKFKFEAVFSKPFDVEKIRSAFKK